MVGSVDSIFQNLRLSVKFEHDFMVGGEFLPRLGDLVKMELKSQENRTQALPGSGR